MITRQTLKFGFIIGLVGGGTMALFAMVAMWATGHGFFTVVNLFAHTFWNDAPLDGEFVLASFELGLVIHLIVSTIVGTVIAILVERGSLDVGAIMALGLGVGAVVWVVQTFAWSAIDDEAQSTFTPWILATAHVVFALGAAGFLNWLRHHEGATTAQEALLEAEHLPLHEGFNAPRPTRTGFSRSLGRDAGAVAAPPSGD